MIEYTRQLQLSVRALTCATRTTYKAPSRKIATTLNRLFWLRCGLLIIGNGLLSTQMSKATSKTAKIVIKVGGYSTYCVPSSIAGVISFHLREHMWLGSGKG